MILRKTLYSTLSVLSFSFIQAQTVTPTVIASDGGSYVNAQGQIEWTIGEPVSETFTNANNSITNGFHQPGLDLATLIKEQRINQEILVYPNPVKENLEINFKGIKSGEYKLVMVDALGKLIYDTRISLSENVQNFHLKMNDVAAGNYFLSIEGANFNKTVKINKVN